MKQNESFPYLALLVVLLCAGMLVSLIHPSRTFSAAENRELQQWVMPWEASLLDRSYQDAASAFVSDQFPGREGWMQMRSDILAALHDRRVEDVYIAEDDSLIQAFVPQMTLAAGQVQAVNEFAAEHADMDVSLLLAPTRIAFAEDTISRNPQEPLQQDVHAQLIDALDEQVRAVDVWDALRSHQQEAIYFRSDHHWTPLGAKYAAEVFLDQPLDAFTSVDAVSGFYGSLARQIAWMICSCSCRKRRRRTRWRILQLARRRRHCMRRTRFLPQIRIRCSSAETRRCFAWTAPWPTASGCSSSRTAMPMHSSRI